MSLYPAIPFGETPDVASLPEPPKRGWEWTEQPPEGRNHTRATWAGVAITAYAKRTGMYRTEPLEAVIGDVLADLRHLCDALGLNMGEIDAQAHRRYVEELGGLDGYGQPVSLAERVARASNRSDTDPTWRTNYEERP